LFLGPDIVPIHPELYAKVQRFGDFFNLNLDGVGEEVYWFLSYIGSIYATNSKKLDEFNTLMGNIQSRQFSQFK